VDCLRERTELALPVASSAPASERRRFGLPPSPPKDVRGVRCELCSAECSIGRGGVGYCGLRRWEGGRYRPLVDAEEGLLHHYLDPHVTNCCSAWACPAGTGAGYPAYAVSDGPELGYRNLAIFLYGCCFDCLYCQNWAHKHLREGRRTRAEELVRLTLEDDRVTCWCWFGGSPEPQLPFAVNATKRMLEAKPKGRVVRVCYEWNGDGNPLLVRRALEDVLESGGNVKFDLKAFHDGLHRALTGRSNRRALENFEMVYDGFYQRRKVPPLLTASTLLVPYYVDSKEVEDLARFISSFDDEIPYSLLVFHPDFEMMDLPITPVEQVMSCYRAAKAHLKNVHIGNAELIPWGVPKV